MIASAVEIANAVEIARGFKIASAVEIARAVESTVIQFDTSHTATKNGAYALRRGEM
jgi:hypothetical protein